MRWPGRIPAGTTCQQIAGNIDVLPTLAKLVDSPLPADRVLDGRDITSLMFNAGAGPVRDTHLYFNANQRLQAIRQGEWKLFVLSQPQKNAKNAQGPALYNLAADPGESKDVSGEHPDIVARLRAEAERREAEVLGNKRPAGRAGDPDGKS
jgi:arylsulfatase A-like enzyme